jgi:hypothetical protein
MRSKPTCHRCQRRRGFILFDIIFGLCRAFERFGPLVLLFALTYGVASASTEAGFMKLPPWPVHDMRRLRDVAELQHVGERCGK